MDDTNQERADLANHPLNDGSEKPHPGDPSSGSRINEARPTRKRTAAALWGSVVAVIVAWIAVAGYGYFILRQHNLQLAKLPSVVNSLTRMQARVDNAEARLQGWMAERDALAKRVAVLDRKVNSVLRLARRQTQELIAQAQGRIEQELDERTQLIDARLTRFESDQHGEDTRLAQLQEEVANVREEMAAVRKDAEQELASMQQQQTQSQAKLDGIANQLDRQRVDFELAKNETRELTPEVSLRVTHSDAKRQRYRGWLWYHPDHRLLWIADQGVQQPVVLRPKHGSEPYELVVTSVKKSSFAGYLLVPAVASSETRVAAAAREEGLAAARPAF